MKIGDDEVKVDVKKIWVKNFKSLRDFTLDLKKVNILVGKNGSGKTNVIEALKLFKMIVSYFKGAEINPFLEWWGYNNAVWKGNERLPVTIGIEYSTDIFGEYMESSSQAQYEVTFSGIGGNFRILEERVTIPGFLEYVNKPPTLEIIFSSNIKKNLEKKLGVTFSEKSFQNKKVQSLFSLHPSTFDLFSRIFKAELKADEKKQNNLKKELFEFFRLFLDEISGLKISTSSDEWILKIATDEFKTRLIFSQLDTVFDMLFDMVGRDISSAVKPVLRHLVKMKSVKENLPVVSQFIEFTEFKEEGKRFFSGEILYMFLRPMWDVVESIACAVIGAYISADKLITLGKLDYKRVKDPIKLKKEITISDDGANLTSALYTLGKGRIPERVDSAIKYAFGENCTLQIEPTPDGRAYIKVLDKGMELNPPSIPDGLYKLITLELALEYEAPIIAVDEFENSLYADVIKYFLDELKNSSSKAILTTHSPAVMDFADPEEIIILKKDENGETKPYRFKDPQKIRDMLKKEGITLSEYIIYHEISKDEEI